MRGQSYSQYLRSPPYPDVGGPAGRTAAKSEQPLPVPFGEAATRDVTVTHWSTVSPVQISRRNRC